MIYNNEKNPERKVVYKRLRNENYETTHLRKVTTQFITKKLLKYGRHELTTTTVLQAPDLGQVHT